MVSKLLFSFLLILISGWVPAQLLQTQVRLFAPPFTSISLGAQPVYPPSIYIHWKSSDTIPWKFNWRTQTLQFESIPNDSLQISFSVMIFEKSIPKNQELNRIENATIYQKYQGNDSYSNLKKSGSIGRGITLGNTQNSTIQSSLNLQMEGQIHPKIALKAALTDQTTPFQPDGTTQRIQDFDRIIIQLNLSKTEWKFGGLDVKMDSGYFLKVQRNINGFQIKNLQKLPSGNLQVYGAAGFNRGKFSRNTFWGGEGVQGPYRLTGNEQEKFLVVLANSEKVYLDGKLLMRGQDLDYTFDYNSAELRFTPKHLITNQSRIIVEFEYLNQSYLRINHSAELKYQSKSAQVTWNHYQESDQRFQYLQGSIDSNWINSLQSVGNEIGKAQIGGATVIGFQPNWVLYEQKDTLGFPGVFVYSQDSSKALFQVTFTLVGEGRGNYVIGPNVQNGRTYLWKAPNVNGTDTIYLGAYEPIVVPIAPQSKSMETFGIHWNHKKWKLKQELAFSLFDPNTFSKLNNSSNFGFARSTFLERNDSFSVAKRKMYLKNTFSQEAIDSIFSIFQPYRNAEFNRTWNTPKQYSGKKEILTRFESQAKWSEGQTIALGFSRLNGFQLLGNSVDLQSAFQSNQWNWKQNWKWGKQFTSNDSTGEVFQGNSEFNAKLSESNPRIPKLQAIYLTEKSSWKKGINLYIPFSFEEFSSKLHWCSGGNSFFLQAGKRNDVQPGSNDFSNEQQAIFSNAGFKHRGNVFQIQWRELKLPHNLEKTENLALQTEGKIEKLKGGLGIQWFQQSTSGKTPKRDFSFLPVAPGLGTHQWNDYNRNGIQELNEFELAFFPDSARFIKLLLPTTSYLDVFQSKTNLQLSLQPGLFIPSNWLKTIYLSSQLQQDRQSWKSKGFEGLLPQINFNVQNTPMFQSQWRNTFWINRNHPKWGLELNYIENQSGTWNSNGLDQRENNETYGIGRFTLNRKIQIRSRGTFQKVNQWSELFTERTYSYQSWDFIPGVQWQINSKVRFNVDGKFSQKKSIAGACQIQEIKADFWLNQSEKGQWKIQYQRTEIDFVGNQRSPLGFEWMQGLVAGKNNIFGMSYNSILKNGMQAQVNYQLRKLGESSRLNHWMQMQLRYFF